MMGQNRDTDPVPKPVPGINLRALPIGPEEAFVLSRIDGRAASAEISLTTGLPPARVTQALDRLAQLGAITWPQAAATLGAARDPSPAFSSTKSSARVKAPSLDSAAPHSAQREKPAAYDLAELEVPADIPVERKRLILDKYYSLDKKNHYELLGVPQTADKAAIKAAYYELVSAFHPDRYFGKNLGAFKQKLEVVFDRLTTAHDALTKKKARAEYDEYLESCRATAGFDSADEDAHRAEVEAIQRQIREEALRSDPPPRAVSLPPPMTPEERRRALARKLGAGSDRPIYSSAPPAPQGREATVQNQQAAAENLRRRYEERVSEAMHQRIGRYIEQADQAEATNNPVAAANALRVACSLAPDDAALAERFQRVDAKAAAALSARYLEQAEYEERDGRFLEAARHYERASRGDPTSARLAERAAHCYLMAKADLRNAAEHAKRAVELSPKTAAYRITLARIYTEAGMEQSALGELERARSLEPDNGTIKDWLKRLK